MTVGGFNKTGWHWTRQGWKRTPKHLQTVRKVAPPSKRKVRKLRRMAAIAPDAPTFAKARELAAEQGRADSAPTLATESAQRTTRPQRPAWAGKYADLTATTPQA